jgi:hypothetical protein
MFFISIPRWSTVKPTAINMLAEDEKCQQSEGTYVSFYGLRGATQKEIWGYYVLFVIWNQCLLKYINSDPVTSLL